MHRLRTLLIGLREDFHLVGNHERRVETETEMSDYRLILVLGKELLRAENAIWLM